MSAMIDKNQSDLIKIIEHITSSLPKFVYNQMTQQISKDNAVTIIEFIKCQKTENNLSDNYKNLLIRTLISLAKYFKDKKFKELTRVDVINYLHSLQKSEEDDPTHKWIGTYNLRRIILIKFFKWLYDPTEEAKKRIIPAVVRNIPQFKRKEQSIYKPDDLWSIDDDLVFLKYCPDKRIQCYHTISRDTSARPSEILKLRVKDINFKLAGDKTYAEISVNGKTGSRMIPLFNSIPYVKDWLNNHLQPGNPNAHLIPSMNRATFGRKLSSLSLNSIYHGYQTKRFPRLLNDENIPMEDKNKIRELLKKPWNPYIRRHTGLTEKSKIKQINEHLLRQHAGWSINSKMPQKYIHYFGNESSDRLKESYGLDTKEQESAKILFYKQCPNCNEQNKPNALFCVNCGFVLTYDAYAETLEEQKQRELEVENLKQKYEQTDLKLNEIMMMIHKNPKLARLKPEVLKTRTLKKR